MKNKIQQLPEKTLGKAGRDYSSRDKELTIVMFPYERHSAFRRAIHDLYKVLAVPFNLIVIEGNAPDDVRSQLEDCENRYGSMTVLYSTRFLSPGEIINLARPQIKTHYSFFMDNEICVKPGCIERMLTNAKDWKADVIFPKHSLVTRQFKTSEEDIVTLETPGLRLTFLCSVGGFAKLLKVDEHNDLYTVGWDLMFEFRSKGLRTLTSDEAWMESFPESAIKGSDRPLYQHQWDLDRHRDVLTYFQRKWNLEIKDGLYQRWFESKSRRVKAVKKPAHLAWEYLFTGPLGSRAKPAAWSLASALVSSGNVSSHDTAGIASGRSESGVS